MTPAAHASGTTTGTLASDRRVSLCCPECKTPLESRPESFYCVRCSHEYRFVSGIPVFTSRDEFYEGKFTQTIPLNRGVRNPLLRTLYLLCEKVSVNLQRERFFKEARRRCLTGTPLVLDLGCGGGWELWKSFGHLVGVDFSFASLQVAQKVYPDVYCARLDKLPFSDHQFDAILSADVLGHIPDKDKEAVCREMWRVLKTGGYCILSFETDSSSANPWIRFAKARPKLYQKYCIEQWGHFGLELPSRALARFVAHGFRPLRIRPGWKWIWAVDGIVSTFHNEYEQELFLLRWVVTLLARISKNNYLTAAIDVGLGLTSRVFEWAIPFDEATSLMVVLQRPASEINTAASPLGSERAIGRL